MTFSAEEVRDDDKSFANDLYNWLVALMPNGDLLNGAVVCDFAGAINFKRAIARWYASRRARQVPDEWEIDVGEKSAAIRHRSGGKLVIKLDRGNALLFDLLHQLAAAPPAPSEEVE